MKKANNVPLRSGLVHSKSMSDLSSLHGEQVASSRSRRHSLAGDLAIRSRSVSTGDLLKWVAVELDTETNLREVFTLQRRPQWKDCIRDGF